MSIRIAEFVVRISYNNQEYTPKQVEEYIHNSIKTGFADSQGIQALVQESEKKFQNSVKKYNLTMEQRLQAKTSPAGKELAQLTLSHSNATIRMIQESGWKRGVLI